MERHGLSTLHLLLVEPSALQARIIRKECETLGLHQITLATNQKEALALMGRARPDLVLSAFYLPDGTGTALVTAMREQAALAAVPFILVSSETSPQALDPVRQSGACAIVPKPFSGTQLYQAIDTVLDFGATGHEIDTELDLEELRVLLVDDSRHARRCMRRVLEGLGLKHFVEAENGQAAVALMSDTLVDLIVTDYNMPEMDGKAFVEYVRNRSWQGSVPILMVTSETDESRLAAVEEAGVSGICDKPFEPAVVRRILSRMLAT